MQVTSVQSPDTQPWRRA